MIKGRVYEYEYSEDELQNSAFVSCDQILDRASFTTVPTWLVEGKECMEGR